MHYPNLKQNHVMFSKRDFFKKNKKDKTKPNQSSKRDKLRRGTWTPGVMVGVVSLCQGSSLHHSHTRWCFSGYVVLAEHPGKVRSRAPHWLWKWTTRQFGLCTQMIFIHLVQSSKEAFDNQHCCILYTKDVKKVNPKSSHHKEKNFFLFL